MRGCLQDLNNIGIARRTIFPRGVEREGKGGKRGERVSSPFSNHINRGLSFTSELFVIALRSMVSDRYG